MKISCADDKFEVTAAFRRWLECDSSVPRSWGALLMALRRDFRYEEIPETWIEDITKELVRKYACRCLCHDNVLWVVLAHV